jgi:BNR/Asp-box repeat.
MRNLASLIVLIAFSGIFETASAQWVPSGQLSNNDVNFFTVDGNNLYAGFDTGGVFLSTNNGTSWNQLNGGLPKNNWSGFRDSVWTRVNAIIKKDGNLFAGTAMGVYISTNNGASWSSTNNGLPKNLYDTSTFIEINAFAVIDNNLFAGTIGKGVFVSSNNGGLWSAVNNGLTDSHINALSSNAGNLFAGTDTLGFFLSANNGALWTVSNSGLLNNVQALVVNGSNLFAGTYQGVYLSINNGANWTKANSGLSDSSVLSLAASGSNVFAATDSGIFLSTNNGTNWAKVNSGLPSLNWKCALTISGSYIFVGTWGGIWRRPISEMLAAPSTTVLSSPKNDSANLDTNLTLSWNATGSESCTLQVSIDSTFASALISQKVTDSTHFHTIGLAKNTKYYWRVNASNAIGSSSWSAVWHFTTISTPPSTVAILIFPSYGASGILVKPALRWNKVATASSYRIQWSTLSDFSTTKDTSGITDTALTLSTLANNTKYYWRIMASNAGGAGNWSSASNFTTIITSPGIVYPANNATSIPVNPTLRWNIVAGATSYQIQMSITTDFSTTVKDSSVLSDTIPLSGLANNTMYYWHVRATNYGGQSVWSTNDSFTTIIPAPSATVLLSPNDSAIIPADSLLLIWHKSGPAVSNYRLQIATDSSMTQFIVQQASITDTFKLIKSLNNGITYWWRVQAQNAAGWGAFSPKIRFIIKLPITAVLPKAFAFKFSGLSASNYFIRCSLPKACNVSFRLFNVQGKLIRTFINAEQSSGYYQIPLNIADLSRGCYLMDFKAGSFAVKRKMSNY